MWVMENSGFELEIVASKLALDNKEYYHVLNDKELFRLED